MPAFLTIVDNKHRSDWIYYHTNLQLTNIGLHWQNCTNSTAVGNIIYFIHIPLCTKQSTAETTWIAQRKHRMCLAGMADPLCTSHAIVFDRVEIGLTRVKPGAKKNVQFLTRLVKKNGYV